MSAAPTKAEMDQKRKQFADSMKHARLLVDDMVRLRLEQERLGEQGPGILNKELQTKREEIANAYQHPDKFQFQLCS